MKILFVTHRYPPRAGGVETHVREIATRLVERGHEVTVFSADASEKMPTENTDEGVRVRRFQSVAPNQSFYIAPQLIPAVRQADADVVHAHNYHAFPLFFAALGVTNERFIVTTHYHGKSASNVRNALLTLYQPIGRWTIQQADSIIAVSEWEQERLQKDFGVNATVIPNGIDVERFIDTDLEQRERPYLLYVGRLEEYKGVQHVIRSLRELPEYDLVVAGSGPYREELEQIARQENVADRVNFLGYVDDDRLPKLYAGAAVYVTMSEFEAYGITVAEALATGTPCLIREAGALEDWCSHEYVICTSPEDIVKDITQIPDSNNINCDVVSWSTVTDELITQYRTT